MAEDITKPTQKTNGKAWQGAFAAFGLVFKRMKENPKPLVVFLAVYAAVGVLGAIAQGNYQYGSQSYVPFEDLVYLVFLVAIPIYALALARGKALTMDEFMRFSPKQYFAMLAATILYLLIIGVSLLFFIVPVVWTLAWFALYPFAIVEKGHGPIAALKYSKSLAQNHKGKVWGLVGVFILAAIAATALSFVPFVGGVASAFLTVWVFGAEAILYRWLLDNEGVTTTQN